MDKTPLELFRERHRENQNGIAVEVVTFSQNKQEEALREAFRYTVKANARFLPSHLVAVRSDGGYGLMDYLGTKNTGQSFYHSDTGIYETRDPVGGAHAVPIVASVENLSRDDTMAILGMMELLTTDATIARLIIPEGFFVFSFTAQWAVGGYDEPETEHERVVRAESLDKAFQKILNVFSGMHENCFDNIMLTTSKGSHRVKIFDEEVFKREVPTIVGPPRHHRLSLE